MRKQTEELAKLVKDYYQYSVDVKMPKSWTTLRKRNSLENDKFVQVYVSDSDFFTLQYDDDTEVSIRHKCVLFQFLDNCTDEDFEEMIKDLKQLLESLKLDLNATIEKNKIEEKRLLQAKMMIIKDRLKELN